MEKRQLKQLLTMCGLQKLLDAHVSLKENGILTPEDAERAVEVLATVMQADSFEKPMVHALNKFTCPGEAPEVSMGRGVAVSEGLDASFKGMIERAAQVLAQSVRESGDLPSPPFMLSQNNWEEGVAFERFQCDGTFESVGPGDLLNELEPNVLLAEYEAHGRACVLTALKKNVT